MTHFNPRLQIRRMIVKRGAHEAYNAAFHPRLNIIRGENSSGKSTLMDFIFYGLGGELTVWRETALSCSEVILEVELNGRSAVFVREISSTAGRPMRILTADLQAAAQPHANWSLHPYRRSASKENFSQVIFRLLGMPETTGDDNSNVTMNQILRLLYADQLSPVDRIFRSEPFDTALTRQTVGDLLCGAFDNGLYRKQLRLREAEKEYTETTADLRNLVNTMKGEKHALTLEWVNAEREVLQQKLRNVHQEAEKLEEKIFHAEVSDGLTLKEQRVSYDGVVKAQQRLLNLKGERDALELEITDSDNFIDALRTKLDQLQDAKLTADTLKGITFIYCPSCFAPLSEDTGDHACALCKSPFDKGRAQDRILSIINETGIQIKQSLALQSERAEELRNWTCPFPKLSGFGLGWLSDINS